MFSRFGNFLGRFFGGAGPLLTDAIIQIVLLRVNGNIDSGSLSDAEKVLAKQAVATFATELANELKGQKG